MDTTRLTSPPLRPPTRSRAPWFLAGGASGLAALAATWWTIQPSANHFAEEDALLRTWFSGGQTAAIMLALGLLGTVLAAAALRLPATRRRLAAPAALVASASLGLLGMGALMSTGYLVAATLPVAGLIVLVQVVRRGGAPAGAVLIGAGALAALGLGSGVVTGEAVSGIAHLMPRLVAELPEVAGHYVVVALLATWVVVTLGSADRAAAWTARHRRTLTLLAALGPVPYALTRLTWLTPWPLLAPDDLTAGTRLWGLMLAASAWVGVVLTIGLIRPWGEVFPRWVPTVGGRSVPMWFVAVPGGLVAAVVTAAAIPFLVIGFREGFVGVAAYALIMPFWAWGPLLGLAVWGHVLHRRRGVTTW